MIILTIYFINSESEENNSNHSKEENLNMESVKQKKTVNPCNEGNSGDCDFKQINLIESGKTHNDITKCNGSEYKKTDCKDSARAVSYTLGSKGKKESEESFRRHSSDMEMDDGEDDLNNFKVGNLEGILLLFFFFFAALNSLIIISNEFKVRCVLF